MVLRLVDRQNYTSFLPQEMLGIHSMLNCLIPKIYWFAHGSSLFFLSKCPPALLICPGEVNIWGLSKSGQPWISVTALTAYVSTLYHREGSLEDRTEIAQRGFHWYLPKRYVKIFSPAPTSILFNHTHPQRWALLLTVATIQGGGSKANLHVPTPTPIEEAWHRLEGKRKHVQVHRTAFCILWFVHTCWLNWIR